MPHITWRAAARTILSFTLLLSVALMIPLGTSATAEARGRWSRSSYRHVARTAPASTPAQGSTPAAEPTETPAEPVADPAPASQPDPAPAETPTAVTPNPAPADTPADVPDPEPVTTPDPASDFFIGAYVPGAPASIAPVTALQSRLGGTLAVVNYFQNTSQGFTSTQASTAAKNGSIPLITLEFWDPAKGVDQPGFSLKSISGGSLDGYLRTYARAAKAFGGEIWLRPLHEMNGTWYPWGGTVNGNSPSDFAPAWKHIRQIFTEEGATNVKFVWCVNNDSVPASSANAISAYWPGDAYVDYVAIDGYNFGTGDSWSTWRSFSSVFGSAYSAVTALSDKPVIVTEMGCSTTGGDKAAWIADMFRVLPVSFPRIEGIVWFNADKERDWRIESSASSLEAFTSGLASL